MVIEVASEHCGMLCDWAGELAMRVQTTRLEAAGGCLRWWWAGEVVVVWRRKKKMREQSPPTAVSVDRTRDLSIFSATLSQLSYAGFVFGAARTTR